MNADKSQRLLQHIRRLAGDPPGTPSDGDLLRRYVDVRDEAAFAALVRRHGAMVYSVCQSVLRQRHDAEDASQATFLILARKAGSIRRQDGLGGWLQRVAYRVALKARTDNIRRQEREAKGARAALAEPAGDELSWSELRSILHAELAALPEQFRAPLVLCYLEGLTQEEAAHRLGWTAATVKGRLQRGREKLRRRLEHRGVALTVALAATLTGHTLAETAVRSSGLLTMRTATTAATALAQEFLRPLLTMKRAMWSAVLLSIGVVSGGIALRSPPSEPRPSGSGEGNRSLTVAAPKEAVDAHGDPLPDGAIARLGTIRFNHGDGLNALFFSPDGKTIYSAGGGNIRLWDAANGKELDRIHTAKPSFDDQIVFLADGKTALSFNDGGRGDVVRRWDLLRKKEKRALTLPPVERQVWDASLNPFSPDGKLAALHVRKPAQVQLFDLTTGKHLYQLAKGEKEFLAVAFAGNDHLVSADKKQNIEIWEARTGKRLRQFHHDAPIRYLLASPDGRWLAALEHLTHSIDANSKVPDKDVVCLWDLSTGVKKHTLAARPKRWLTEVYFSPDGKRLLTLSRSIERSELTIWDVETGQRVREMSDVAWSGILAVSADGSRLAVGTGPGKFELWNLQTGRQLTSEDSRHAQATAVVLAPTGERATLIGYYSTSFWDSTKGRRLHSFDRPRYIPYRFGLSSDGLYAATFPDFDGLIWDIAAGKCLHTLRLPREYQYLLASTFSPDSSLLATWLSDKQTLVHFWDVRSGKLVRSFEEKKAFEGKPAGLLGHMSFTADGKTLFVAGKRVVAYEVASGKELFSWRLKPLPNTSGHRVKVFGAPESDDEQIGWRSLAVSPDGSRIAAVLFDVGFSYQRQENRLALYDAQSGRILRRWNDSGQYTMSCCEPLVFSHDGQLLASSDGHVVHLWEVATCKLIRSFKDHRGAIPALAFSRDDRRLASASSDSTVLIWDATGAPAKASPLSEAKLNECWNDLTAEDASRAHRAVWTLIRAPRESMPFLKAHLHPVKPVRREQIDRWIQDLDADAFAVRQKAAAELEKLGERAEPALRRALENKPTLEQRRRIEPMLAKLDAAIPSGEALRSLRAVRVLTHIDTAEAQQLLHEMANGRR